MPPPIAVQIERGAKRVFATAIAWPGWSRSGKTEEAALDALLASAVRYAAVATRAGARFDSPAAVRDLDVRETASGAGGTDFGVPSVAPAADAEPVAGADLERLDALLTAAWATFDAAAAAHRGADLRKGPRGGGRPLTKIIGHVLEAEEAYLHQLGSKRPKLAKDASVATRLTAVREASRIALVARAGDEPLPDPNKVRKPWSPRYFVRRSAWHALDHAWEIEDRAT
ncbi:MAG: DinB family protein [Chloroflexota bacterium]